MRLGAARFVAGETLDECIPVLRRLNDAGLHANTTLLGEAIPDPENAAAAVAAYEEILDRLAAEKLRANVALKLTHLGLLFDEETAYTGLERLVAHAGGLGLFVRIDMEQSEYVEPTLRIYERLRAGGHDNVGVVLQAYLYASPANLARILPLAPNVRIVKGAYLEPPEIAYPEKADVDRAFVELVVAGLRGGAYVAVATHDERIIELVRAFAEREGIARDRFELQMLYGVRPATPAEPRRAGVQGARRDAVRSGLVSVPDAKACRAAGQPPLLPPQPPPPMTTLPARAEVVVVGGGAVGTSIAFHLAEEGVGVCLLERDALSSGSTSRAAGGVRTQFSDPLNIAIGLRGVEAFTRFAERPGGEIDFDQVGYLFLLDREEDVAIFEQSVALQNELGVPSRLVEPAEAASLSPLAGLDGVLAATFCPIDGHASPEAVAQGYAAGARGQRRDGRDGLRRDRRRRRGRRRDRRRDRPGHDRDRRRSCAPPASGLRSSRARPASSFEWSRSSGRS